MHFILSFICFYEKIKCKRLRVKTSIQLHEFKEKVKCRFYSFFHKVCLVFANSSKYESESWARNLSLFLYNTVEGMGIGEVSHLPPF